MVPTNERGPSPPYTMKLESLRSAAPALHNRCKTDTKTSQIEEKCTTIRIQGGKTNSITTETKAVEAELLF